MPKILKPEDVPKLNYVPMPEFKEQVVLISVPQEPGPIIVLPEYNVTVEVTWKDIAELAIAHAAEATGKPRPIKALK